MVAKMAAYAAGCRHAGVTGAAGGAGQVGARVVLELRRRELVERQERLRRYEL